MKKSLFNIVALVFIMLAACKKEARKIDGRALQAGMPLVRDTVVLPQVISGIRTLDADTIYILDGKTYVPNGGVLNIPAGTRIEAVRKDNPGDASALIVARGGKLNACADSCDPIVFTPCINGSNPVADPGDWGGIVILGKAPVNKVNPVIQGIVGPLGIDVTYGGADSLDISGALCFVRIEYAGAFVTPGRRLSGLTCAGAGSGTIIGYVQAAWCAGDAFEFLGGTVNASRLVANNMSDDGLDFDYGYRGAIQFALITRANCCYSQVYADANGIECDNDETCNSGDRPRTRPILSNITIVGGQASAIAGTLYGARFRNNTDYLLRNSVIIGYSGAIRVDQCALPADTFPSFNTAEFNVLHAFGGVTGFPPTNLVVPNTAFASLNAPFTCGTDGTGQNYSPTAPILPAGTGANFTTRWPLNIIPTANSFIIKTVTYKGAFAPDNRNWLACWSTCVGFLPPAM